MMKVVNEDNLRAIAPASGAARSPSESGADDKIHTIRLRHTRTTILRILDAQPGYRMNSRVLDQVMVDMALSSTHEELRGILAWLEQEGMITIQSVQDVIVATLRELGADVARGRTLHRDIERPSPIPYEFLIEQAARLSFRQPRTRSWDALNDPARLLGQIASHCAQGCSRSAGLGHAGTSRNVLASMPFAGLSMSLARP